MCHSRPRLKHSRAGYSGNPVWPWATPSLAKITGSAPRRGRRVNGRWNTTSRYQAQWIPVPDQVEDTLFAGMTGWGAGPGWPTGWPRARAIGPPRASRGMGWLIFYKGMPVEAVSMRLPRHALPRRGNPRLATGLGPGKLAAVPGNAIKCSVDQARHKYGQGLPSGQGLASGHQQRIHPTPYHPEQHERSALRNLARQHRVHPAHSGLTQRCCKSGSFTSFRMTSLGVR